MPGLGTRNESLWIARVLLISIYDGQNIFDLLGSESNDQHSQKGVWFEQIPQSYEAWDLLAIYL